MKKGLVLVVAVLFIMAPGLVAAATYQIAVSSAADGYYNHTWWSGGHDNYHDYSSNIIYTTYWYAGCCEGRYREAKLTFDLTDLAAAGVSADDITSATLNLNLTKVYNNNSGDSRGNYGAWAGGINYAGQNQKVLVADGIGWQSYDFTNAFKTRYAAGDATAYFQGDHNNLPYDGAGYEFTSAEEGHPAYLEITTAGGSAVPLPPSAALLFSGLFGLLGWRKKS